MLTKPTHIAHLSLADPELLHPWDESKVEQAYQPADEDLMSRLEPISFRGLAALTLATAEWLVWRFEGIDEDEETSPYTFVGCYVEAAWAGNVHMAYMRYIETDADDWRGPARGPLNIAVAMIIDLMYDWRHHEHPERYACWLTNLARLVLPDAARATFDKWQAGCIERLLQHCLASVLALDEDHDEFFDDVDTRGDPVPAELFDLTRPFDPAETPKQLDAFLRGLDPDANPFLHSAEEMAEFEDWQGTPYELSTL